ncbi:sensor histidine kinase NtrY-like [Novispirillum itersonii]|uniref:Nitrogen regulation protein n=1 Tax=Novispirillum itersonii TaxID=189 RepID=A0A7W9ZEE2_NOVIT|nr:PAS domain-containing sensor histidine kinase [Novispirillum itersonii]MBB6209978.1 two-component system nitrogen regulation sensor histidine kinase NtrY [Novispirillum itersonii]
MLQALSQLMKSPRFLMRLGVWGRRMHLGRKLAIGLTLAALTSGIATYGVMTGVWAPSNPDSNALLVLINLDLVLLLILAAVVARRLIRLWLDRRSGGAGTRLHLRFVGLFSAVAVTPAILMAVFSALFFDISIQSWFGERVRTALSESQAVAQSYLREHQQQIAGQALVVANDLQRNWARLSLSQQNLERFLASQGNLRGLTEIVVFDTAGKVQARAGYTFSLQFEDVPFWAIERAQNGEVAVLTSENDDRVRALMKLDTFPELYLYVGRFVDQSVIQHISRTNRAVKDYQSLQTGRSDLVIKFSLIFVVVALLLLFAAVWVGLSIATRLTRPIGELIDAAERMRTGDLSVRVSEMTASDEIAALSRAFNRMSRQIFSQQQDLLNTNRVLDERNRFTETVLAGMTAGVISIAPDSTITLVNRSASQLLHLEPEALVGCPLADCLPEFVDLLEQATRREDLTAQTQMELTRDGSRRILLVRAAGESLSGEVIGTVFTFDDITALQAAQRTAAWADVARRIAHEIKNPLTPIQLSAERLERKYLRQIAEDPETFSLCTKTIIRHVGDIGRMVDEFSSFARMPQPVMRAENLNELLYQAVFLQRTAYPAITFTLEQPETPVRLLCDGRLLVQAFTNLLKNAVEAIDGRDSPVDPGRIAVVMRADLLEAQQVRQIRISITDNGKGLPKENRSRLTEPYVTTRAKGTGLGLAIVKKVMEDHGADLILEDAEGGGARISVLLSSPMETEPSLTENTGSVTDHGA